MSHLVTALHGKDHLLGAKISIAFFNDSLRGFENLVLTSLFAFSVSGQFSLTLLTVSSVYG